MPLTDAHKLFWVRLVHTLIYLVNGGACFVLLYKCVTGRGRDMGYGSLSRLVAFETVILFANGIKCPMSPLAEK